MAQNAEARAFLRRLAELPETPGVDLSPAIAPSLEDEGQLRRLFATNRTNTRLEDPYVGLVDVFGEKTERIRRIHARTIKDEDDLNKRYVMPLGSDQRRKDGEDAMALSMEDFKARWAIFSEGALSQLTNWNNVIVAGGSVLACLAPLPERVVKQDSKRALRKYYNSGEFPASDVDIFLYGLTHQQAEEKCLEIYNAVRDSVPWEVCAVRTKHAVSIHCQYPYRPVQIVLRIYQSPAEILAGFDVDSACVAFDGTRVLAAPRAVVALMTQCNRVAMDRRSPSYEVRLAKYAARGFEVHVPDLRREDFDPTIFERAVYRVSGLARLLVLEKLATEEARDGYLDHRRRMRGRPNNSSRPTNRRERRLKGDLKAAVEFGGLKMSDYDVAFHIPYGPGITAKRISKLVYQTDLGMNSTFNPKNKGRKLHRHPAFFGTMKEALDDCCEYCPAPTTEEEKELFCKEQEQFITGRVSFIQDDPGRQSITGSFHPIDSGEWSEQAYLKPLAKLFTHISSYNRVEVKDFLKRNATAINARDHLGRTPLQFALLCNAEEICWDLIEAGGRMTARMVDGRCSLHLACQMGLESVVRRLLERSETNLKEKAQKGKTNDEDIEMKDRENSETRDSSEDDWSSDHDTDEDYKEAKREAITKAEPQGEHDVLDESVDQPDILDIDVPDWDQSLTALGYAIIGGHVSIIKVLVAAGADCKTPRKLSDAYRGTATFFPLSLTALTPSEVVGAQIAEHLITAGGASCSAADSDALTIFHRLISLNKPLIIETILRVDPTAKVASRFLYTKTFQGALHPIVTAFANGQRAMVVVLLAYAGTRTFIDLETYDRSVAANPSQNSFYARAGEENWKSSTLQPLEASLFDYNDLWQLVLALEPEAVRNSTPRGVYLYQRQNSLRRSMLDFLRSAVREIKRRSREPAAADTNYPNTEEPRYRSALDLSDLEISEQNDWDTIAIVLETMNKELSDRITRKARKSGSNDVEKVEARKREQACRILPYFQGVLAEFEKARAKTWDELYPELQSSWAEDYKDHDFDPDDQDALKQRINQELNSTANMAHQDAIIPTGVTRRTGTHTVTNPNSEEGQVDNIKSKPFKRYTVFNSSGGLDDAGAHLIPLYDELYEACWNGGDEKIKSLCLPPQDDTARPTSGTRDLLQITASVIYTDHMGYMPRGYTPFFVAILARKWDTARLILEIAQRQFVKGDDVEDVNKVTRIMNIIKFDDDDSDDAGSTHSSCASDETSKGPLGFSNLAERYKSVQVKVKPNRLLSYVTQHPYEATPRMEALSGYTDPICHAAQLSDLEAFNEIADMMENLKEPMNLYESLRDTIVENDSPDLLDAYIRRTGDGLHLPRAKVEETSKDKPPRRKQDGDEAEEAQRIYLGLNVNGKKRKDLAQKEDPDAFPEVQFDTHEGAAIGWRAVSKGAVAVIEYLNGPKAFEAYKFYSENYSGKLARRIAEALQDPGRFPSMIGFSATKLAETPVLASVWNPPGWSPLHPTFVLPTLKKLMELHPKLTVEGLRSQVKPNRMSAFLVLCTTKLPLEIFDWMLANGADPMVRDERGWNIFHLIFLADYEFDLRCSEPDDPELYFITHRTKFDTNWALIEHALTKLPTETIQALMVQQSRTLRNTPFAIAVKAGNTKLVELLLRKSKEAVAPALVLRDSTGATPLHTAVLKGYSKIVSLLLDAGVPDLLYLENGVGSTPMEMARLQYLTWSLRNLAGNIDIPNGFYINFVNYLDLDKIPGMRDRDELEVKMLRTVVDRMKTSDVPAKKPQLFEVLSTFADRSEEEYARWEAQKPEDVVKLEDDADPVDTRDVVATFNAVSGAVVEVHQRQLVHLHDVQRAVLTAVEAQSTSTHNLWTVYGEGLDEEQADPTENPAYSIILGLPNIDLEPSADS